MLKKIELTAEQKEILTSFIVRFLPKRGNRMKHSGNELEYVTAKIDRIMKQQFGFNVSRRNVLDRFEKLQYDIFTKNGDWDSENKKMKPSAKGDMVRMDDGYADAMFIYIDVDALVVRELKLATFTLPPNANLQTIERKKQLDEQIAIFKKIFIRQTETP